METAGHVWITTDWSTLWNGQHNIQKYCDELWLVQYLRYVGLGALIVSVTIRVGI